MLLSRRPAPRVRAEARHYDEEGRSPALQRGYSILSATIGSTPAALRAG
jgi:hypothetical protein